MKKTKVKHVKFSPEEMAYEMPDEIDFTRSVSVIGRGLFAEELSGQKPAVIGDVTVEKSKLTIDLKDGRQISAPLEWYPRLMYASPSERKRWRIIMGGRAVRWDSLELAIAAKALFDGTRAIESKASLQKWLNTRNTGKKKSA